MSRLTTQIRQHILAKLIEHRFKKQFDKYVDNYTEFTEEVYNDIYSTEQRKFMETIPDGWLLKASRMWINIQGSGKSITFNRVDVTKYFAKNTNKYKPISYAHHGTCIHTDSAFSAIVIKISKDGESYMIGTALA